MPGCEICTRVKQRATAFYILDRIAPLGDDAVCRTAVDAAVALLENATDKADAPAVWMLSVKQMTNLLRHPNRAFREVVRQRLSATPDRVIKSYLTHALILENEKPFIHSWQEPAQFKVAY